MKLRAPRLATAIATVALLTGCSGDRASAPSASATSAAPTAAVSAEPLRAPRALVIVMDLSGSMRAIFEDASPVVAPRRPTRLDAMKNAVLDAVESEPEGGKIGVVVFGERTYTLLPTTTDRALVRKLVTKLGSGTIEDGGSAIAEGVAMASRILEEETTLERTILLFADSENTGNGIQPAAAAEIAKKAHARVLAIHVGDGREADVVDHTTPDGELVYAREKFPANPEELKGIATVTGGAFLLAKTPAELLGATRTLLR